MKKNNVESIIKKMERSINFYVSGIKNLPHHVDKDDIKQQVRLRIFLASKKYDKKYAENTFFQVVIRNEIRNIVSNFYRDKKSRYYLNDGEYRNFEDHVYSGKTVNDNFLKLIDFIVNEFSDPELNILRNQIMNLFSKISKSLSPRAGKVLKMIVRGNTLKEIGKALKISPQLVHAIKTFDIIPAIKEEMNNYKYSYNYL